MDNKVKVPNKFTLFNWSKMTEANEHYEVRIKIARYFGDSINPDNHQNPYGFESAFREIKECAYSQQRNLIPSANNLLTELMIEAIYRVYGEDVARRVNDTL